MKYDKCPKCNLNYKLVEDKFCSVCQKNDKLDDENDDSENLCPLCYKNKVEYDEIMCDKCLQKRKKQQENERE